MTKRGKLLPEAGILLVLARLKCKTSSMTEQAEMMGVDPAFISDFFDAACERIDTLHGFRLAPENMESVFGPRLQTYREAIERAYAKKLGHQGPLALPGFFVDCCCAMDGVRQHICRPSEDQSDFHNPYVGFHNAGYLGVTGPDGMMMCMSQAFEGTINDPGMVIDANLNVHLMNAATPGQTYAKAIGDKAFGRTAFVAALPKANMVHNFSQIELTAISSIRVMVEWTFGEIRSTFPLVDFVVKSRLLGSMPLRMFRVAALLRNMKRCMDGSLASLFFEVQPPTLAEYMV